MGKPIRLVTLDHHTKVTEDWKEVAEFYRRNIWAIAKGNVRPKDAQRYAAEALDCAKMLYPQP